MLRDERPRAHGAGYAGGRTPRTAGSGLPPYYAERIDAIPPAAAVSARRLAAPSDPEAQAERLFRDFKLGLFTLVVVALVLVAYFWDGGRGAGDEVPEAEDGVLSMTLAGTRRSEVGFVTQRPGVTGRGDTPARETLPARPFPRGAGTRAEATSRRAGTAAAGGGGRTWSSTRSSTRYSTPPSTRSSVRSTMRSSTPSSARREDATGGRTFTYVAKPGDTLSAIALRFYGDASAWRRVFEANRRRLRRPPDLRAGMRIVIPVKSGSSSRGVTGGGG